MPKYLTKKDYQRHFQSIKKVRKTAARYAVQMNDRMMKRHTQLHKATIYELGQKVLVRYRPKRRGKFPPKRRHIIERNRKIEMYKIDIHRPLRAETKY